MTQQLGLLGLFDAAAHNTATAVVEAPPSPPPQRSRPQRQATPKKTMNPPTKSVIQVEGEQRTHRWVSVSAEYGRREHHLHRAATVTGGARAYRALPLRESSLSHLLLGSNALP